MFESQHGSEATANSLPTANRNARQKQIKKDLADYIKARDTYEKLYSKTINPADSQHARPLSTTEN